MSRQADLGYLKKTTTFEPVTACPWCSSDDVDHLVHRGDGLEVKRCRECHLGFLAELPTDLAVFYDAEYYERSIIPGTAPAVSGYEHYEREYTPSSFRWLTALLASIKPGKGSLFDFGAATGTFLAMARKEGFNVVGSELTTEGVAAAGAKGIALRQGWFDPSDWDGQQFDVVTALEVLEHVGDLRATLAGLKSIMADDGVFVFLVPNVTDDIIRSYGAQALDFNKSFDHTLYLNPTLLKSACEEVFGDGSLTLYTPNVEQWGQTVSAALGVIRSVPAQSTPEQKIFDILNGEATIEAIRTIDEAIATSLMAAKFFVPSLADDALERARELGGSDADLATVTAQVFRNRGEIYRAMRLLEHRVLGDSENEDPLAAQLLIEVVDDLTTMLGIAEPGLTAGFQRMHQRLDAAETLKSVIEDTIGGDSSYDGPEHLVETLVDQARQEAHEAEERARRAEMAARDLSGALEWSEARRLHAVDVADEERKRADRHAATLDGIYASRAWKIASSLWNLKRLTPRGRPDDDDRAGDFFDTEPIEPGLPAPGVLVSVIMPVYNKGRTIRESIDSVLNQTLRDVEVIVWDDGSTDPATIAELEALEDLPRLTVVRSTNRGVVAARNAAMRLARGEFMVCLDPDDTIHPTYLEKAALFLRSQPDTAIVYPWQRSIGSVEEVWETQNLDPKTIADGNHVPVCAMFRREVFERTGGFSSDMDRGFEDWEFWTHAAALGFRGRVIREALFEYRHSSDPSESRDAAARDFRAELGDLIRDRHPQLEWVANTRTHGAEPLLLDFTPPAIPTGDADPIILTVPWFTVGGADTVVENLTRHWQESGRTVVVIATVGVDEGMKDRIDDLLDITPYAYQLPSILPPQHWYGFVRSVVRALPNATVMNIGSAWLYHHAARLKADCPDVRIIDQQFNDSGHVAGNAKARKSIDLTVTAYRDLRDALDLEDDDPHQTVYIGIEPRSVTQPEIDEIRRELGVDSTTQLVSFVGRLSKEKRPKWLLPLADALEPLGAKVVIVGTGPLRKKLGDDFKRHDAIIWLKRISDPYPLLATSSAAVLPSKIEGIPLTAMESLAVGTPVVATAVGGLPELEHVRGLHLTHPKRVDEFVDTTLKLVAGDKELGIELPEELTLNRMLEAYDDAISSLSDR